MNFINIIAPPVVGGIIGYVTNYIAIKMLFRPLKPIMIGRFRVPFTPGIVPRRKDELAGVLGKSIVDQFWGADDLENVFTSDSFKEAVAERITLVLSDPDTRLRFLDTEQQSEQLRKLKDELCVRIQASILRADLAKLISEQGGRIVRGRLAGIVLSEGMISSIAPPLSEQIKKYILENGRELILPLIDNELTELSREPVVNIMDKVFADQDAQRAAVGNIYARFMETHVRPIVENIDISGMITEKVRQMDASSVEKLVLTVVRRELGYVVALGALLGFIIGAVNIFI